MNKERALASNQFKWDVNDFTEKLLVVDYSYIELAESKDELMTIYNRLQLFVLNNGAR
jgi:hypothetical protein